MFLPQMNLAIFYVRGTKTQLFFLHCLLALESCCMGSEAARSGSQLAKERAMIKAEGGIVPVMTANSPPEGNTTFVDGTTWCVAEAGVSQLDLQNALDWACGMGIADCSPVQVGGPCFDPDTLFYHASYAFNSYYQINGNSDIACNFGGTATRTTRDPSYGSCQYPVSRSVPSSAKYSHPLRKERGVVVMGIVLLWSLLSWQ